MLGADPAALRQLAATIDNFAGELSSLAGQLSAVVADALWQGMDAEELAEQWDASGRAALINAAGSLRNASTALLRNADQQEETSAADSASIATAPVTALGPTSPSSSGGGGGRDRDDRDDEDARDSRDRRSDRRDDEEPSDGSHDVPGGVPGFPGGLGQPVPGTSVPHPSPPDWSPPDEGAGEHGSDSWWTTGDDHVVEGAAYAGATAMSGSWPHAADNLRHYLGNSGDTLTQDIDAMLEDCPELRGQVDADVQNMAHNAVEQARASGATGPVTFPISTDWQGYYITKGESSDWFYATGGMAYSIQGEVTVYPPDTPGGEWRYETDTSVSYRDRYNWDGGKSTQIGPLTVTDDQLAELHRAGIAQEYNMTGESGNRHATGSVP
jgi:hypothetical protein